MKKLSSITKSLIGGIVTVTTSLLAGSGIASVDPMVDAPALSRSIGGMSFVGGILQRAGGPESTASLAIALDRVAAYDHLIAAAAPEEPADTNSPGIDPIETGAIVAGVFNSIAIPIQRFPVTKRWARIMHEIEECAAPGSCAAENKLLERIAAKTQGKTLAEKIEIVNSAINMTIRYREDQSLYGKLDYWATPNEILARASGDCEDFAILKMTALMRAGLPARSLSLVVLRDNGRGVFHAVLAVATSSGSFILDNARPKVAMDADLPNYQPLYSLSEARAWIHGTKAKDRPAVAQSGDFSTIAPGEDVVSDAHRDPASDFNPLSLRPSLLPLN